MYIYIYPRTNVQYFIFLGSNFLQKMAPQVWRMPSLFSDDEHFLTTQAGMWQKILPVAINHQHEYNQDSYWLSDFFWIAVWSWCLNTIHVPMIFYGFNISSHTIKTNCTSLEAFVCCSAYETMKLWAVLWSTLCLTYTHLLFFVRKEKKSVNRILDIPVAEFWIFG